MALFQSQAKISNINEIEGILAVNKGGTNASTEVGARSNLSTYSTIQVDQYLEEKLDKINISTWQDDEAPLLIIMGQSNADGRGAKADLADMASFNFGAASIAGAEPYVKIFNKSITRNPANSSVNRVYNGAWEDYTGSNGMIVSPQTGTLSTSCGPELAFAYIWANKIYPNVARSLYILKCAIGGTPLYYSGASADTNWASNAGQIRELFFKYLAQPAISSLLNSGKKPRLIGIYWAQGESDTDTTANANAYETNLTNFIADVRAKTGFTDGKFILQSLSNYSNTTQWNTVKQAFINVANNDPRSKVIKIDGTDGTFPSNRYRSDTIHFTAIGCATNAAKAFAELEFPGSKYQTPVNDFELIGSALEINAAIPSSIITYGGLGGIPQKLSRPTSAGDAQSITWVNDPTVSARATFSTVPSPHFKLNALDGATDQEIIFRMAHSGDADTKPGFIMRATHGATDFNSGVLSQIRLAGGQLTTFLETGTGSTATWAAQTGSPTTITPTPPNNQLVWYRFRLVGTTFTAWKSDYNSANVLSRLPLESEWIQIYTVTNASFPASGNTYITLYNGMMNVSAPYASFCHFPLIIANKL